MFEWLEKNKWSIFVVTCNIFLAYYVFSLYTMTPQPSKIVVFDLDETLGIFVQLGIFCNCLKQVTNQNITKKEFFQIMDLYPEFLRPKIFNILRYIKQQKMKGVCSKVIIFTNNQGPKIWAQNIKDYFEHKIQYKLFNQLIGAYKIRGILNEPERTSHDKSYQDLKSISKISDTTQICFLDDQYHPNMVHKNIYYIYLPGYICTLSYEEMIRRFVESPVSNKFVTNNQIFASTMLNRMKQYNQTENQNSNYKT